MDVARVVESLYLPWSIQQVYAQAKQGRLSELFYDQMPKESLLYAVGPWMSTTSDAQTALSISCQSRHKPAYPEIEKPPFGWTGVEDDIKLTVALDGRMLTMEMDTYMINLPGHVARLHLTHKNWSFTPAESVNLTDLGPGCTAHAAEPRSVHSIEASQQNHWFHRVLDQDAARIDSLLGLLISLMADAEAKGELITLEEAAQLLYHDVRANSSLRLDWLSWLNAPVPMEVSEPGSPLALSPPRTRQSHSQDSSSSSLLLGAESVRARPSCNGNSHHSPESVHGDLSLEEWLPNET